MISSSRTASSSSLFSSTANSGSTKSVSPDTERSCTTPGICGAGAGAHRHDEAVVAQRDVGVGDDVGHAAALHELLELARQRVAQAADRARARAPARRWPGRARCRRRRARAAARLRGAETRPAARADRAAPGGARRGGGRTRRRCGWSPASGAPRRASCRRARSPRARRCADAAARRQRRCSGGSPCCSSSRKHCQARSSAASAAARSAVGVSARQRSCPALDAANSATRAQTRGNSSASEIAGPHGPSIVARRVAVGNPAHRLANRRSSIRLAPKFQRPTRSPCSGSP